MTKTTSKKERSGKIEVPLYSIDGKQIKKVLLPIQFSEEFRSDLIKRAVLSEESMERQPKGAYAFAGLETSTRYRGVKDAYASLKNKGQAMLPREVKPKGAMGKVKRIPSSVKGRRAHPPKVAKKIVEKINKKEYKKAMRSALASSLLSEVVENRVNLSNFGLENMIFPIVLEDKFESLEKIKEVISVLKTLKLDSLVSESKSKKRIKSGVGRRMKRVKKMPKYLLIVTSDKSDGTSGRNLAGVDIVSVSNLKVKHLAPGSLPG